jgi:hypothetical protein
MATTLCKWIHGSLKLGLIRKRYAANWTNSAYHGTVVWSWQLAMMAAGLERQLGRCGSSAVPDFCNNSTLHGKVTAAYNHLWDLIEANGNQLGGEVWSWTYTNGEFQVTPLGALPPPPGSSPTESDVRQLWSLTFLAVTRNKNLNTSTSSGSSSTSNGSGTATGSASSTPGTTATSSGAAAALRLSKDYGTVGVAMGLWALFGLAL